MNILKSIALSTKWILRIVFAALLVLSLTLNISSFVGGALYASASTLYGAITGAETLLKRHDRRLGRLGAEVTENKRLLASARRELARPPGDQMVRFRGQHVRLKDAVARTTDRVSTRAVKAATRNTASMAGEALPYVGVAVIVGVTALEVRDQCETIRDMTALRRSFDLTAGPSEDELTVCSMKVPTREELWAAALDAPGKAWAFAKDVTPDLTELSEIEWPSVASMAAVWRSVTDAGARAWESTRDRSSEVFQWMTE